jgi:hypothetical protein
MPDVTLGAQDRIRFSRSFVFINILGVTFIFVTQTSTDRNQKPRVRSSAAKSALASFELWRLGLLPAISAPQSPHPFSRPFVFIHILGVTFIFDEQRTVYRRKKLWDCDSVHRRTAT